MERQLVEGGPDKEGVSGRRKGSMLLGASDPRELRKRTVR